MKDEAIGLKEQAIGLRESAYKLMFDYLIGKSGGVLTLSPEQLEKIIGISAKQQSVLRQEGNFPISYKKIGRLIVYSIDSLIKYLLDGETEFEEKKQKINKVSHKSNREDLNHIFKLRNFATDVKEEVKELTLMADLMLKIADTTETYNKLKDGVKPNVKEVQQNNCGKNAESKHNLIKIKKV